MGDMKNKKNKGDIFFNICFAIFMFVWIVPVVSFFIKAIKELIFDFKDFIKMFCEAPVKTTLCFGISILALLIMIHIINSWDKRDDFFYFVASILSSPSEYIYKKRKKQLLNYHNEIKELVDSIYCFSNIDSKKFSKKDFLKFADDISKQNERLEKNRQSLEKQNDRINMVVQVFILCCGIITSLFL